MPIRWRLTLFHALTTLVIAALVAGTFAVVAVLSVRTNVEAPARERAREVARIIEFGGTVDPAALTQFGEDGPFVVVRDDQGRILAQTADAPRLLPDDDPPVWRQALAAGEATGGRANVLTVDDGVVTGGEDSYVYAVPVARAGSSVVVEAGQSYGETPGGPFYIAVGIGGAAIVAALLAIGGSYLLARRALAPVNAIVQSARAITEGDLSRRLPVKTRRDELARLATTFNDLLARLEVAFAQRDATLAHHRRFVADASHELRTPLTSILGYARLLREWGLTDPGTARESVALIEQEAARMEELVEGLLNLARGDEGAPLERAEHDLRDVAAGATAAARGAAKGRVGIVYRPPPAPVIAPFDRDRVQQVATILLDNAVKYTPAGGTVTVAVRSHGRGVELAVADTGIGIPEEHVRHVFERFYRVDDARATAGTGLGLAIARQIAERHGGTIAVVSAPGRGSTFTLHLPVGPTPDPSSAARIKRSGSVWSARRWSRWLWGRAAREPRRRSLPPPASPPGAAQDETDQGAAEDQPRRVDAVAQK